MKTELLQNAIKLFREYGIRSLSIADIARLSGIPQKTFHRHFTGKEALLKACVRYRFNQEVLFKQTDEAILDFLLNYAEAYPVLLQRINRRCFRDIRKYYPAAYGLLTESLEHNAQICQRKAREAIANGYLRKQIPPGLIYNFLREHFLKLFIGDDSGKEYDQLIPGLLVTFARGISTPKGQAYLDKKIKTRLRYEIN